MSLEMLNAYVAGYGDHLFDQQILAVQAGFWAGYYSKAKHPKDVKSIVTAMLNKRKHAEQKTRAPAPEVDVAAYLEMERQFQERMSL